MVCYVPIFSNHFIFGAQSCCITICSFSDEVTSEASANSSRRNSSVYDSDGSVRSLESIEKVLQRRNKMRTRVVYDDEDETSDSESEDERSNKRKKNLRNGGEKRARVGK